MPDIHHIFHIQAEPKVVYTAISSPRGLDSWWTLNSVGEPKMDSIYTFYFGPEYDWRAKVIQVEESKSITWLMTRAMDDWVGTKVGFVLEPKEGGTHVHFFHLGWKESNEHFGITTFCWGQLLHGLKNYIEKGTVIPHPLRN